MKHGFIYMILFLLILCGCDKRKQELDTNETKIILKDDLNIEINDEVLSSGLITKIDNGTIIEEKIDTSELGNKELIIKYLDNNNEEKEYKINIEIVDTIKPVIDSKDSFTIIEGNKIDLVSKINVSDNSLEKIIPSIEGQYNISKVGTYNLKVVAMDSSGNKVDKDIKLVVEKKKEEDNKKSDVQVEDKTFVTSKGFKGEVKDGKTYIEGILIANKTYSLPKNYAPNGVLDVAKKAFDEMAADAKKEGFNLRLQSGFRSYDTQKKLYNNYVNRDGKKAADTYSARPGYSEHQTGLAYDICESHVSACINSGFNDTKPAKWMAQNAYKYGLILRYPNGKSNETGYKYESWHFRYVGKDLAYKLYNNGDWLTLEDYFGITSVYDN